MDKSQKVLSDLVVYMKYARYIPKLNRRENWTEIVMRCADMHAKKYPHIADEIYRVFSKYVLDKKVLPSMRSLQFGGKAIEVNNTRLFNCAYMPVDNIKAFSEAMFNLLSGAGQGISVQKHHVDKLPEIHKPNPKKTKRFVVSDDIQGWSDAIKVLMKSYVNGGYTIKFDYSQIRKKGAKLLTSGGVAPGPQPLKECILKIQGILDSKDDFSKLTTLECHDIMCFIAQAVLAGGIRRSSIISIFSIDDELMTTCKYGNWWELNSQRAMANNSAMVIRHKIKREDFNYFWEKVKEGKGDPAFIFSNDKNMGYNPCCEASLKENTYCNLTEINLASVENQEDFLERCYAASFIGTLQAGYTDFYYLRDKWRENTELDSLLGVSITGIASGNLNIVDLSEGAKLVVETNRKVAEQIGINAAARTTCIKPAGTSSLVVGSSSGIHAYYAQYYIRRVRVNKNEEIYTYLKNNLPQLVEDDWMNPKDTAVISMPVKSPDGCIIRNETSVDLLERIKKVYNEWVLPGHIKGSNTHNISATVSIKNDEWDAVRDWMWNNKKFYNGLSILPYNGGTFKQAPFEECTKEVYDNLMQYVNQVNLDDVIELDDNVNLQAEGACSGGNCEIK